MTRTSIKSGIYLMGLVYESMVQSKEWKKQTIESKFWKIIPQAYIKKQT